jgi:hypothetical protein
VAQVIRGRPLQVVDRRYQPWFQPTAFLHLRGRQSFAPLTAPRLGQVLERASIGFEPMELLDEGRPQRRRETGAHLRDILKRAALVIANQDRVEGPADRIVPTDRELATL